MNEKFVNAFEAFGKKMKMYDRLDEEVAEDSKALYTLAGEVFKEDKLLSGHWNIIVDSRSVRFISSRLRHKAKLKEYKKKLQKHLYENRLTIYVDKKVRAILDLNSFNIEFHIYRFNAEILKKFVDDYGIVIVKYLPSDFGIDIKTIISLDSTIRAILES